MSITKYPLSGFVAAAAAAVVSVLFLTILVSVNPSFTKLLMFLWVF